MDKYIEYWVVNYTKDPKYKYFNVAGNNDLGLPDSISIQDTQKRYKIPFPLVAMNRNTRKFLTGLKPLQGNWHYGDRLKGDVKELMIFLINPEAMEVYYFLGYYPDSAETFSRRFIWDIKRPDYESGPTHSIGMTRKA